MECIEKDSLAEVMETFSKMREFQLTHNRLKKDVDQLYALANTEPIDSVIREVLLRASIKEFFSMVEADLYLINQFNPYDGFSPKATIVDKFKKTYRRHAQAFKKEALNSKYQSTSFRFFLMMLEKRHGFTHPMGRPSLRINEEGLKLYTTVYITYIEHVNALMRNVGVSTQLSQ